MSRFNAKLNIIALSAGSFVMGSACRDLIFNGEMLGFFGLLGVGICTLVITHEVTK